MPPVEGKVRCNYLNQPLINGDRLRTAKTLVDKAIKVRLIKSQRIFIDVVHGITAKDLKSLIIMTMIFQWTHTDDCDDSAVGKESVLCAWPISCNPRRPTCKRMGGAATTTALFPTTPSTWSWNWSHRWGWQQWWWWWGYLTEQRWDPFHHSPQTHDKACWFLCAQVYLAIAYLRDKIVPRSSVYLTKLLLGIQGDVLKVKNYLKKRQYFFNW